MSLLDTASLIVTPNGYKEGKLYSVIPSDGSGDMNVVRATTATRVNSAGLVESMANNIPRLDYSNGTCPSLLVEPQRTNLALYSSSFDNAYWTKYQASVTANVATAPDGTMTADKLIDNTNNDIHTAYAAYTISSATTISVYVKSAEYSKISISNLSDGGNVIFDLLSASVVSSSGNFVSAQIKSSNNGWYRISATTNGTSGFKAMGFILVNNAGSVSFAGTGTSGVFLWGAQVELGSYPTSYIPTTTASVTRNAESLSTSSIPSLFGLSEGSFFIDLTFDNTNPNGAIPLFLRSSVSNQFNHATYLQFGSNDVNLSVYNSGTLQASIAGGTFTNGQNIKIGLAYKANDFVMYVNGVLIGTDTSGSISTSLAFIDIGSYLFLQSTFQYNGIVKATALWQTRLTNTQLAQLTTI